MSLTGFDLGEIDDLFKDTLKDGIHDDDFDVDAELKKPAISNQGDVWTLGRHEIVCGNSTDTAVFKKLLGNAK